MVFMGKISFAIDINSIEISRVYIISSESKWQMLKYEVNLPLKRI
jgi:hypothetical protein